MSAARLIIEKVATALLIALAVAMAKHALAQGVPIGALPNATTPLSGTEYTILSQNGTTVKATVAQVIVPGITIPTGTLLGNNTGVTAAAVALNSSAARTLLGLGTAALANTGSSGHTLPYLDVSNTWQVLQTFSGGIAVPVLNLTTLQVTGVSSLGTGSADYAILQGGASAASIGTNAGALSLAPFSGSTLLAAGGTLGMAGSASGVVTLTTQAAAGTFNWNFPITAGGAGLPLLSGGGGSSPMTWGTISGNTSKFVTTTGTLTSGNCAQWDASGNAVQAAGACGTGSVSAGTAGQMAYYATSSSTLSGNANATMSGGQQTLGVTGSAAGKLVLSGATTGAVTITGSTATVGTYEFDLPVTAGATGSPLLSGGGGGVAMTYGARSGNTTTFGTTTGALTSGNFPKFDSSGNIVDSGIVAGTFLNWGGAKTTAFNAVANTQYCVDTATTGAVTMTLPASPADGDKVGFIDCKSNFAVANFTVARNGHTIMAIAADMTVNTSNAAATLVYSTTYTDWRMF